MNPRADTEVLHTRPLPARSLWTRQRCGSVYGDLTLVEVLPALNTLLVQDRVPGACSVLGREKSGQGCASLEQSLRSFAPVHFSLGLLCRGSVKSDLTLGEVLAVLSPLLVQGLVRSLCRVGKNWLESNLMLT